MKLNLRLTDDNIGDIVYVETEDRFSINGEILNVSESSIEVKDIKTHNLFTIFLFEINKFEIVKSKNHEEKPSSIQVPRAAIGPGAFLKVTVDLEKIHPSQYDHPVFGKLSRNESVLAFCKLPAPRIDGDEGVCQYLVISNPDDSYKMCLDHLKSSAVIGVSFYESTDQTQYRYIILSCPSFCLLIDILALDSDQIIDNYPDLVTLFNDDKHLKLVYGGSNLFLFIHTLFRVSLNYFIDLEMMHYGLHNLRVTEPLREPLSYIDIVQQLFNVTFKIKGQAYYTADDALNKLAFNTYYLIPMYQFMLNRLLEPVRVISNRVCQMNIEEVINDNQATNVTASHLSYDNFAILPRSLQFWTYRDTSSMLQAKKIVDKELHNEKQEFSKKTSDVVEINKTIAQRQEEKDQIGMTYYERLSDSENEEIEAFQKSNLLWRSEQPNSKDLEKDNEGVRHDTMKLGIGRGRGQSIRNMQSNEISSLKEEIPRGEKDSVQYEKKFENTYLYQENRNTDMTRMSSNFNDKGCSVCSLEGKNACQSDDEKKMDPEIIPQRDMFLRDDVEKEFEIDHHVEDNTTSCIHLNTQDQIYSFGRGTMNHLKNLGSFPSGSIDGFKGSLNNDMNAINYETQGHSTNDAPLSNGSPIHESDKYRTSMSPLIRDVTHEDLMTNRSMGRGKSPIVRKVDYYTNNDNDQYAIISETKIGQYNDVFNAEMDHKTSFNGGYSVKNDTQSSQMSIQSLGRGKSQITKKHDSYPNSESSEYKGILTERNTSQKSFMEETKKSNVSLEARVGNKTLNMGFQKWNTQQGISNVDIKDNNGELNGGVNRKIFNGDSNGNVKRQSSYEAIQSLGRGMSPFKTNIDTYPSNRNIECNVVIKERENIQQAPNKEAEESDDEFVERIMKYNDCKKDITNSCEKIQGLGRGVSPIAKNFASYPSNNSIEYNRVMEERFKKEDEESNDELDGRRNGGIFMNNNDCGKDIISSCEKTQSLGRGVSLFAKNIAAYSSNNSIEYNRVVEEKFMKEDEESNDEFDGRRNGGIFMNNYDCEKDVISSCEKIQSLGCGVSPFAKNIAAYSSNNSIEYNRVVAERFMKEDEESNEEFDGRRNGGIFMNNYDCEKDLISSCEKIPRLGCGASAVTKNLDEYPSSENSDYNLDVNSKKIKPPSSANSTPDLYVHQARNNTRCLITDNNTHSMISPRSLDHDNTVAYHHLEPDFCDVPQSSWNKNRVGKLSLDNYNEEVLPDNSNLVEQSIIWNDISIQGERITDELYEQFGIV